MATTPLAESRLDPSDTPPHPGRRLTEEEFVDWCLGFEHIRAEWVDGEVVVMSPANIRHVRLVDFLSRVIGDFVEQRGLGEVFTQEYTCRFRGRRRLLRLLPDVLFVSRERLGLLQNTYLDGPPDLAIEVVSPDSASRDYREKYLDYQKAGVREYWIVDPLANNVEAYRREGRRYRHVAEADGRLTSEVLPGFFLRPGWLWSDPLPKVRDVLRELGV